MPKLLPPRMQDLWGNSQLYEYPSLTAGCDPHLQKGLSNWGFKKAKT